MIYGVQVMPGAGGAGIGGTTFVVDFENDVYTLGGVSKTLADVVDITSYLGAGFYEINASETPPEFVGDFLAALVDLSAGWSLVVDLEFYSGKVPGRHIIGGVDSGEAFDHYMQFEVSVGQLRGEQGDLSDNLFASMAAPAATRARVGLTLGSGEVTVTKEGGTTVTETFATVNPVLGKMFIGTSFTGDTLTSGQTPITIYSIKLYPKLSPTDLQTAVDTGSEP